MVCVICHLSYGEFLLFYHLNLISLNEKFWSVGDHNKVLECCTVDNFKGSFSIAMKTKLKQCKFSQGNPMYDLQVKIY